MIRFEQIQCLRRTAYLVGLPFGRVPLAARAAAFRPGAFVDDIGWPISVKEAEGNIERKRNVPKAAGADPVFTILILGNLLECHANGFAQLFPGLAQQQSAEADAVSDAGINRARSAGFGGDP